MRSGSIPTVAGLASVQTTDVLLGDSP